jgi:STE24 endopeptidase
MNNLSYLFLGFVFASTAMRWLLSMRQSAAVKAHREQVPAPFAARISLADHRKAADYTIARGRLGRLDITLDAVLLLLFTLGGGISYLDALWSRLHWSQPLQGTAVVLSLFAITSVIGLPLSLWNTFRLEARFGFNRMTLGIYFKDLLKGWGLGLALGAPLIFLVLFLMARAGDAWWFYAWLLWLGFSLLMTWAWPTFFAPLFNKFTPLKDAALAERINALLQRCGFASEGVFVMDGSTRSTHGNAYFTGLGRHKRIVFFDTLLGTLTPHEIEAVLAHELGHYKLHHIRQRLTLSFVLGFVALAALGLLANSPEFYTAFGVQQPSAHAALLLFMLALAPFTYFLTPLGAWWSRRHEFQADEFASHHTDAHELGVALIKLYKDNATTLTPDALHSAFYDSHPPALVRIANLERLARSAQ